MKTKEDIAQVLKTIEETTAFAKAEIPTTAEFRDISTFQRMRALAAETASNNQAAYTAFVESHLGAIILKGSKAKQLAFAEVAKKVGSTLVFDIDAFYEALTLNAFYMMGGTGNLGVDQVALVFTELRLKSRNELDMKRMREPDFQWMFMHSWQTNEAFAEGIRKSVFLTNGIQLTLKAILRHAGTESLNNPMPRTTVPLVIIGMKDAEDELFHEAFSHGYIVVDVDAVEATDEVVTQTFIELRDIIKTKTTP